MVYGRLIYNNVKEYTPSWFKTIPYAQTVKPTFIRLPQRQSKFNADPKVKAMWILMGKTLARYPFIWQAYIFLNAYAFFAVCYYPWLWVYQSNNRCRTLEYAIEQEKAYKDSKPKEEEEE